MSNRSEWWFPNFFSKSHISICWKRYKTDKKFCAEHERVLGGKLTTICLGTLYCKVHKGAPLDYPLGALAYDSFLNLTGNLINNFTANTY